MNLTIGFLLLMIAIIILDNLISKANNNINASSISGITVLITIAYAITLAYYYVLYKLADTASNTAKTYIESKTRGNLLDSPYQHERLYGLYLGVKKVPTIVKIIVTILTITYIVNLYIVLQLPSIHSSNTLGMIESLQSINDLLDIVKTLLEVYVLYLLLTNLSDIFAIKYPDKAFQVYALASFKDLIRARIQNQ